MGKAQQDPRRTWGNLRSIWIEPIRSIEESCSGFMGVETDSTIDLIQVDRIRLWLAARVRHGLLTTHSQQLTKCLQPRKGCP